MSDLTPASEKKPLSLEEIQANLEKTIANAKLIRDNSILEIKRSEAILKEVNKQLAKA